MKKILVSLVISVSLLSSSFAFADLTEQQRIDDAVTLVSLYEHSYAPMPWKKKLWKLDHDAMANQLMADAASAKNDLEFYDAIAGYLRNFHDAHVSWGIPSSLVASLPFDADYFNGEVLIYNINREELPKEKFPFEIGDRIIAVDGKPVDQHLQKLIRYCDTGSKLTNLRKAARYLTFMAQWRFPFIPTESTFTIERASDKTQQSVLLSWKREGSSLVPFVDRKNKAAKLAKMSLSRPLKKNPLEPHIQQGPQLDEKSGKSRIYTYAPFFPLWDTFVERKREQLISGVINLHGHKIGFIRIPSWSYEDEVAVLNFFKEEIPYLNDNTEALIIDQTNNPGGHICLAEQVLSHFTQKPISALMTQIKPTRAWFVEYENEFSTLEDPQEQQLAEVNFLRPIREALADGRDLSDPIPICGNLDGLIHPQNDPAQIYHKPTLLLIDEFSCSTGDMFPSMGQDGGVFSKIFGHRSVGCGGNVVGVQYLGHSDVTVRVTQSLAVRQKPVRLTDGTDTYYIENIGVQPDIAYTVGGDDFRDNFSKYRAAIDQAVLSLIEEKK